MKLEVKIVKEVDSIEQAEQNYSHLKERLQDQPDLLFTALVTNLTILEE